MSMLSNAAAWLASQLRTHAAVSITYTRGGTTLTLDATLGESKVVASMADGRVHVERTDRDFIVTHSAIESIHPPKRGDEIRVTLGGVTEVYEVTIPSSMEQTWRWSDHDNTIVRIFGKRIGME